MRVWIAWLVIACEQALWVKESLQGSLWWLRAALQLGCHRSINNNQSAQTGNTHQYCKHKSINVELHLYLRSVSTNKTIYFIAMQTYKELIHLYCILSLVSYTDRQGILKKLKRLEVLQCNISSCTFSYYTLHVFMWAQ
jgi:hypothetical protein